ncbi:MAG TPA: glycoside hydrolase family 3 C-terminal domain-containing protein [Pseudonocardiaceae bacterium]|nr:glycoside hydrolase family 3 C-terminal domain-containing protein [Pseudonocardiaceae bacterium]
MSSRRWLAMAGIIGLSVAGLAGPTATTAAAATCPWVGSTAPVPQRVAQVLAQLTTAQKISLVHGTGGSYVGNTPAIPALCIPAIGLEDGPAGVGEGLGGVTQLPAPVAAAATWDTAAEQQYGAVVGSEEFGKGASIDLGPTVNIIRDPRWGRAFESMSEDPYLDGQLGAAEIRGVQGTGELAQVKHLGVYNQETNRNTPQDNAVIDPRAEQEIYFPQFQASVQQGAASSVMCAYSYVNGTNACENPVLLNQALDTEFKFPGFVTSDWGGTHSTVAAASSGLDMQMPDDSFFGAALQTAVNNGQVSMTTLNNMVSRILTEEFTFGLFDNGPHGSTTATVTSAAHQATATRIAEEGTVLLRNNGNVLPLGTTTKSIAVIGTDGSTAPRTDGGGSAGVSSSGTVTPLQGITSRAGSGVTVGFSAGNSANDTLPDVPASALTPATGTGSGLTGQYFNNMTLSGTPAFTRTDAGVDFNFNGASPGTGVGATQWSAKWTGKVTPTTTGTYTFATTSDDGSRLFVNGQEIINDFQDQAATTTTGTINLTAGVPVSIELDYFQDGGASQVSLGWAPPGFTTPAITAAVNLARTSNVAVVFANNFESEGSDLSSIDLPGDQNLLISSVAAANPNTIVVLNTGSAVTMPWLSSVAGVLENWYPGQTDGSAIAAVLFGDVNPSGKLPVSFPKSLADVPASTAAQWPGVNGNVQYSEGVDVGYRWYQAKGIAPLFPFGFGLSYTSFGYSALHVSAVDTHGNATVTATVTNTGTEAGSDVAQLYVGDPATTGEPPEQLKGFQRVTLQPGASTTVSFPVSLHDLAFWNDATSSWNTATGTYGIMVGDTSASPQLAGTLAVTSTATGNAVTVTNPQGMSSPVGTAASLPITASDSAAGQTLTYTAAGLPAGMTIDANSGVISGSATTAGTNTVTVTATDATGAVGRTTFVWTATKPVATAPAGATGPIVAGVSPTLCVDDRAASTANNNPIQIFTCNNTAAQSWTVAAGNTLQVLGKCMDVTAAGTANNTKVQLFDCNGTGAQVWVPQANGSLLNPASGRCLDDPGATTTVSTQLGIFDCNGTAAQRWTLP